MKKNDLQLFRNILRVLEKSLNIHSDVETEHNGLSIGQSHVIMELNNIGCCSVKDLCVLMGLDKSTMSRTIDSLVSLGLAERRENINDRRFLDISLTDKGKEKAVAINCVCTDFYSEVFKLIPKNKHDDIIESLSILTDAIGKYKKNKGKN